MSTIIRYKFRVYRVFVLRKLRERELSNRKAGELLKETELNKGAATVSSDTTALPKLKDIGITRDQSSNWQRIADIPEESSYLISYQMRYVMQITIALVMWPMLNL